MLEKFERITEMKINVGANALFIYSEQYVMDGDTEIIIANHIGSYLINAVQKPLIDSALQDYPQYAAMFDGLIGD
ncbi:MAG: hypothetical protein WC476_12470 [Phycisphaerae bacterium]|jgi:hypothetical protein